MSKLLGITKTGDWLAILGQMHEELALRRERVIAAAAFGKDVEKTWGLYDGYRQAVEKLESFGSNDGTKES